MKKVTFLAAIIALLGMTSLDASAQTFTQQGQTQTEQQGQEEKKKKSFNTNFLNPYKQP